MKPRKLRLDIEYDDAVLASLANHYGKRKGTPSDLRFGVTALINAWLQDLAAELAQKQDKAS